MDKQSQFQLSTRERNSLEQLVNDQTAHPQARITAAVMLDLELSNKQFADEAYVSESTARAFLRRGNWQRDSLQQARMRRYLVDRTQDRPDTQLLLQAAFALPGSSSP